VTFVDQIGDGLKFEKHCVVLSLVHTDDNVEFNFVESRPCRFGPVYTLVATKSTVSATKSTELATMSTATSCRIQFFAKTGNKVDCIGDSRQLPMCRRFRQQFASVYRALDCASRLCICLSVLCCVWNDLAFHVIPVKYNFTVMTDKL